MYITNDYNDLNQDDDDDDDNGGGGGGGYGDCDNHENNDDTFKGSKVDYLSAGAWLWHWTTSDPESLCETHHNAELNKEI